MAQASEVPLDSRAQMASPVSPDPQAFPVKASRDPKASLDLLDLQAQPAPQAVSSAPVTLHCWVFCIHGSWILSLSDNFFKKACENFDCDISDFASTHMTNGGILFRTMSAWFNFAAVNECLTNNGGCSQLCIDTYESFYCSCRDGFVLQRDPFTCPCESALVHTSFSCSDRQICIHTEAVRHVMETTVAI